MPFKNKEDEKKYKKKYYEKNKKQFRNKANEYYKNNKEKVKEDTTNYRKSDVGKSVYKKSRVQVKVRRVVSVENAILNENYGRKWDLMEVIKLLELREKGNTMTIIAKKLNRSIKGVEAKYYKEINKINKDKKS